MCSYYYFSRHYQIADKIKSLYLKHYAYFLTSNTTRVVQHYFYIAELVQILVLTAHYGESPYKTCLYGDFLKLVWWRAREQYFDHRDHCPEPTLRSTAVIWTQMCQSVF